MQEMLKKERSRMEKEHEEELRRLEANHEAELQSLRAEVEKHLATIAAVQARPRWGAGGLRCGAPGAGPGVQAVAGQRASGDGPPSPDLVVDEVLEDLAALRGEDAGGGSAGALSGAADSGAGAAANRVRDRKREPRVPLQRPAEHAKDGEEKAEKEKAEQAEKEGKAEKAERKEKQDRAKDEEQAANAEPGGGEVLLPSDRPAAADDAFSEPEEVGGDGSGSETDADEQKGEELSVKPFSLRLIEAHLEKIRRHVQPEPRLRPAHDMTQAMGGVVIAGFQCLQPENRAALSAMRVTHIISCCPSRSVAGLRHLQLDFEDSAFMPVLRLLPVVNKFLLTKEPDKRVLIHCRGGVNRCATIAVALRMVEIMRGVFKQRCPPPESPHFLLMDAWKKVAEHRGTPILKNVYFQRQLLLFAQLLFYSPSFDVQWPEDWGPEVWLGDEQVPREEAKRLRTLRGKVERACCEADVERGDAICYSSSSRIVEPLLKKGRLRALAEQLPVAA